MTRELWCRCCSTGLCNRWRGMYTSLGIAQRDNRKFVTCWPMHGVWRRGPRATFNDLWTCDWPQISAEEYDNVQGEAWAVSPGPTKLIKTQPGRVIQTDLPHPPEHYARQFIPSAPVQQLVDSCVKELEDAPQLLGISLRVVRPHHRTRKNSPLGKFVTMIRSYISRYPDIRVFLSSDRHSVAEDVCEMFPGRVIYLENHSKFNSREGTQKALADLYLLARADHIIGSYWSSFSGTAGILQGMYSYEPITQAKIMGEQLVRNPLR
jgi:hypothetical protein